MRSELPRVNALVSFLGDYAPSYLANMKRNFPTYSELLKSGVPLGKVPATSKTDRIVLINLTQESLRIAKNHAEPNMDRMRVRLARARMLRLVSNIAATITSVGLLSAILGQSSKAVIVVTAMLNFLVTSVALVANYLEAPLYGDQGSPVDLLQTLITSTVEAEQIDSALEVLRHNKGTNDEIFSLVSKANATIARLRTAELQLWGSTNR